jgi:hypothetical protein
MRLYMSRKQVAGLSARVNSCDWLLLRMSAAAGPHCSDEMMGWNAAAREKENYSRQGGDCQAECGQREILSWWRASDFLFATSFLACNLRAQITPDKTRKI